MGAQLFHVDAQKVMKRIVIFRDFANTLKNGQTQSEVLWCWSTWRKLQSLLRIQTQT